MQPYTPISYRGFGGLNEDENPVALPEQDLVVADNMAMYGNILGTRPGLEQEASGEDYEGDIDPTPAGNVSAQLIFEFAQGPDITSGGVSRRGDESLLIVMTQGETNPNESELWLDDGGTVGSVPLATAGSATDGQDNVWVAAVHQDAVWLAGGAPDDRMMYWEFDSGGAGSLTVVDIPNLTGTPTSGYPKFVFAKWGRVFACGIRPDKGVAAEEDNSYNRMIVRYHTIGTDPKTAANWEIGNSIGSGERIGDLGGLADYGDEYTTGFGEYQDADGDWLLVLTNKKLASIRRDSNTGDFLHDDDINNGCVHQRAFVSLGVDAGDAIYMSERGIHSLRQSQKFGAREDSFLSWKIRRTFADLNPSRLHLACGAYDDTEGWVLFAVSSSGQTSHDTVLCLDVKNTRELDSANAKWYVWRMPSTFRINCMTQAHDAQGKRRIYVGTIDNAGTCRVGRFTRSTYTDFGDGYNWKWATKYSDMGSGSTEKQLGDMYLDVGPGGNYKPSVRTRFDFGARSGGSRQITLPTDQNAVWDTSTWDQFEWGAGNEIIRQSKIYQGGRFFNVSFEFSHSGVNEPGFFAGFTQEVAPVGRSRAA